MVMVMILAVLATYIIMNKCYGYRRIPPYCQKLQYSFHISGGSSQVGTFCGFVTRALFVEPMVW